jgi:hypothetical protein
VPLSFSRRVVKDCQCDEQPMIADVRDSHNLVVTAEKAPSERRLPDSPLGVFQNPMIEATVKDCKRHDGGLADWVGR